MQPAGPGNRGRFGGALRGMNARHDAPPGPEAPAQGRALPLAVSSPSQPEGPRGPWAPRAARAAEGACQCAPVRAWGSPGSPTPAMEPPHPRMRQRRRPPSSLPSASRPAGRHGAKGPQPTNLKLAFRSGPCIGRKFRESLRRVGGATKTPRAGASPSRGRSRSHSCARKSFRMVSTHAAPSRLVYYAFARLVLFHEPRRVALVTVAPAPQVEWGKACDIRTPARPSRLQFSESVRRRCRRRRRNVTYTVQRWTEELHRVTYNMQPTTCKRLVQHAREIAQG
jgi:hypothetical protein